MLAFVAVVGGGAGNIRNFNCLNTSQVVDLKAIVECQLICSE